MAQHMGASSMQSPRLGAAGSRQPLKPLVHSRTVLQETMREVNLLLNCNTPSHLQKFLNLTARGMLCMLECIVQGFLRAGVDSFRLSITACWESHRK